MCVLSLLQTLLFLAAVGSVIAPYRGYEVAEGQQDVGYESSLAGPTFGGGRREVYPAVKYVTPHSTGYVEPVGNLYPDPPSYYGAGDHFGVGHGDLPRRVKIQVRQRRLL